MSSEAITRNDLTAILNEVLPPTPSEYRKLLWTNPSPTADFAAQTVSLDLSDFDEVEICARRYKTEDSSVLANSAIGQVAVIDSVYGGTGLYRGATVSTSGVYFASGYNGNSANNAYLVPTKIYGIKYERVYPPQVEEWEEIPLTVTVTTGVTSGYTCKAYRCNDLLQFVVTNINKSSSTAVGSNMWAANITGLPSNFIDVITGSYYSSSHIDVYFQCTSSTTATITARVLGANLASNANITGISAMTRFI